MTKSEWEFQAKRVRDQLLAKYSDLQLVWSERERIVEFYQEMANEYKGLNFVYKAEGHKE